MALNLGHLLKGNFGCVRPMWSNLLLISGFHFYTNAAILIPPLTLVSQSLMGSNLFDIIFACFKHNLTYISRIWFYCLNSSYRLIFTNFIQIFSQVAAKLLHGEVPEQSPDEQRHWHRWAACQSATLDPETDQRIIGKMLLYLAYKVLHSSAGF